MAVCARRHWNGLVASWPACPMGRHGATVGPQGAPRRPLGPHSPLGGNPAKGILPSWPDTVLSHGNPAILPGHGHHGHHGYHGRNGRHGHCGHHEWGGMGALWAPLEPPWGILTHWGAMGPMGPQIWCDASSILGIQNEHFGMSQSPKMAIWACLNCQEHFGMPQSQKMLIWACRNRKK